VNYPRILPVGEATFTVEFGDRVDIALNARVHALAAALAHAPFTGLRETVPTYRSLLVCYDPQYITEVKQGLEHALESLDEAPLLAGRQVEIPVQYGGEAGPNLAQVATHCGLTPAEVVRRHSAPLYQVAMLGFAPGFAYLLGLDPTLETPRLATPRTRIAPGSVGIAGAQTGVYALPTPGGWQVIGRTMLPLFDPTRDEPCLLQAGDRVRFKAV